jgi:hypothetical protein
MSATKKNGAESPASETPGRPVLHVCTTIDHPGIAFMPIDPSQ